MCVRARLNDTRTFAQGNRRGREMCATDNAIRVCVCGYNKVIRVDPEYIRVNRSMIEWQREKKYAHMHKFIQYNNRER